MLRWIAAGIVFTLAAAGPARADSASGKATYDKQCASCHGADGHGNAAKAKVLKIDAKTLDLGRAEAKSASRDDKKKILLEGKGKMPPYGKKLSPADADAVLDYADSLAGGKAAATPPVPVPAVEGPGKPKATATGDKAAAGHDDAKATALWKKSCAGCHGADGTGSAAKAKALKVDAATLNLGRPEAASMSKDDMKKMITDGKGKMPAYAKKLKPDEIDLLAEHSVRLAEAARGKK